MTDYLQALREDIQDWCRDKNPTKHSLFLVWGVYVFYKIWRKEVIWWNPLQYLDLGIHEIGHWVTRVFGMNVSVAMGTGAQWMLPVFVMGAFFKAREYFGIAFCFSWLALSFQNSSEYCSSATEMGLVIGHIGAGELYHDWNYMLSKMGILDYDMMIARYIHNIALFWDLVFMVLALWLIYSMRRTRPSKKF